MRVFPEHIHQQNVMNHIVVHYTSSALSDAVGADAAESIRVGLNTAVSVGHVSVLSWPL